MNNHPVNPAMKHNLLPCLASIAGLLLLPALSAVTAEPSLDELVPAVAKYESGANAGPLRQFERAIRESAGDPVRRPQVEAALAKLLAPSATFEARRFACAQLAIIGTDASLPAIAELLNNPETTGIACLAIGTRPSARANEVLRRALATATGLARAQIIDTLGDRQDPLAVKALVEFARDRDTKVAESAIVSLGKIGDDPARKVIDGLRKEANPARARAVAEASLLVAEKLAAGGDAKAATALYEELLQPSQPLWVRRGALGALLPLDRDGGERRILAVLRGSDAALKPVAIAGVPALKSKDASVEMGRQMATLSPPEQVWMIEALAVRGDPGARSVIRAKLAAEDPSVRRAAIAAVGRLEDASAVPLLSQVLAGAKGSEEREAVEEALTRLQGGAQTDQAIIAELRQAPEAAKGPFISVLARRGSRAAVAALLDETGHANAAVARAAFQALGRVATPDDLPALLQKLVALPNPEARTDAEGAVERVLGRIADPAQRSPAVCDMLGRTSDLEARASLLRVLPACGDARGFAALRQEFDNAEPRLRDTALRALADWPDASGWQLLAGIYTQPENETYRALALRALVRLAREENARANPRLIERYRQLLEGAKTDDDRKLILSALAGAAHPDALPLAVPLLDNPAVRAEATVAVKTIAEAIKAQHPQAAREALGKLK